VTSKNPVTSLGFRADFWVLVFLLNKHSGENGGRIFADQARSQIAGVLVDIGWLNVT
jgi:hypothetical protein